LASFAVLMKARSKNSRILRNPPVLNLATVRSTRHLASQLAASQLATMPSASPTLINHQLVLGEVRSMQLPIVPQQTNESRLGDLLGGLLAAFEDADHLGSLITPPVFDAAVLYAELEAMEQTAPVFVELFAALRHVVKQAELLQKQYWVVVANPPYMGSKSMNSHLKDFAQANYPDSKSDLFAVFVERIIGMTTADGFMGLMSPFTWMFLSSYEKLRKHILNRNTLTSLIRPEYHAFFESAYVPICTFTLSKKVLPEYPGTFIDLTQFYGADLQPVKTLEAIANPNCGYLYHAKATDFAKIPGSPIAYWASSKVKNIFSKRSPLESVAETRIGMATGDNERFMRNWHEVSIQKIGFSFGDRQEAKQSGMKWFPYNIRR